MAQLRTQRKRLFFDIETSPNLGLFWEAGYKKNISTSDIIKERSIICICYKWEDDESVKALSWDKDQSDKKMLEAFIKICNEADEVVGHNSDRFDIKWVRTRCLYHNLEAIDNITSIDTLKVARSKFKFNSNKLDYIGKYLNVGQKIETSYEMWKDIFLKNDRKALRQMVEYCKQDVNLLEAVYKKLRINITPKTHFGMIFGGAKMDCPECGSDDIIIHANRLNANGLRKKVMKCKTCGKHHVRTVKN